MRPGKQVESPEASPACGAQFCLRMKRKISECHLTTYLTLGPKCQLPEKTFFVMTFLLCNYPSFNASLNFPFRSKTHWGHAGKLLPGLLYVLYYPRTPSSNNYIVTGALTTPLPLTRGYYYITLIVGKCHAQTHNNHLRGGRAAKSCYTCSNKSCKKLQRIQKYNRF